MQIRIARDVASIACVELDLVLRNSKKNRNFSSGNDVNSMRTYIALNIASIAHVETSAFFEKFKKRFSWNFSKFLDV